MSQLNLDFWIDWVREWLHAGIRDAVVCPGSRSSPLLQGMIATGWNLESCVDERSAGYRAIGMAQALKRPVIVLTTSGTAAANLFPAIAEAYFACVPIVAWTADRPPEWIGQEDNQAIFQSNMFGRHAKGFDLPIEGSEAHSSTVTWHATRIVREAIHHLRVNLRPVQINVPMREPLYSCDPRSVTVPIGDWESTVTPHESRVVTEAFGARPLLLRAQGTSNHLIPADFPQFAEILSQAELRLPAESWVHTFNELPHLKPTSIITEGHNPLSKLLRQALRTWEFQHFHFGESDAEVFMRPVIKISALPAVSNEWRAQFDGIVAQSLAQARQAWKRANGLEFNVFQHILPTLMTPDELHLGNSLAVRLASFYPDLHPSVRTWSNRGTSGIDGCLSTAMGHAVGNPNATHVLILGDLSFLYDRNGLWRDPVPPNLKIVVLNNREGAIFRALDGPSHWPNSMHYWSTPHQRSAQLAAEEFGIEYHVARNSVENERAWQEIRCSDCACILEVFSDPTETANSYHSILAAMREGTSYEH